MSNYCCAVIGKKLIKMLLLAPMLLGILLLSTDVVIAQVWTGLAGTFTPEAESAKKSALGVLGYGTFQHKDPFTGTIRAWGNVTNPMDDGSDPDWSEMEVSYLAPPGVYKCGKVEFCSKYRVQVLLLQVANGGSMSLVAKFDSNDFPATCSSCQSVTLSVPFLPFHYVHDFDNFAYLVWVEVYRINSIAQPLVGTIRLK